MHAYMYVCVYYYGAMYYLKFCPKVFDVQCTWVSSTTSDLSAVPATHVPQVAWQPLVGWDDSNHGPMEPPKRYKGYGKMICLAPER